MDLVSEAPLNGLALCAGAGGLELGLKLALGERYKCVGYVEREAYAASALVARMEDQALDSAPIWDDVATFPCEPWRGKVDIISAGFPCQPVSAAGARLGTDDERWLWPHIARIIRTVAPSYVFLENVRGLLSASKGDAFGEVVGTLADLGYGVEWDCFTAGEVGAPHKRERLFILAHPDFGGFGVNRPPALSGHDRLHDPDGGLPDVADTDRLRAPRGSGGPGEPPSWGARDQPAGSGGVLGDPFGADVALGESRPVPRPLTAPFPPGPALRDAWAAILETRPELAPALEPRVRGSLDGVAYRVDRLRLAGNGVVPLVAATAFLALASRAGLTCVEQESLAA